MHIEVLTWAEIQALPEFKDDGIYTDGTYWNLGKEEDFAEKYPDRIIELLTEVPDSDGDYECKAFFYPACIIKRFIPNTQSTHRILKRSPHGIPI